MVPSAAEEEHVRTPRYQQIADALRTRILAGEFAAGRLLPSESGLRVAIRRQPGHDPPCPRAIARRGPVGHRQGLGWYASGDEVHQSLDELETLEHQLTSSGVEAARRVLDFSFGVAPAPAAQRSAPTACWSCAGSTSPTVSRSPGSPCGALRHSARRSLVTMSRRVRSTNSWPTPPVSSRRRQPDHRGGRCVSRRRRTPRRSHRISGTDLRTNGACRRWSSVLFSEHVYPGHRMAFTVDLAPGASSDAPAGLRLVE